MKSRSVSFPTVGFAFATLLFLLAPAFTSAASCPQLTAAMRLGSRDSTTGGQVRLLQDFLFIYLYGSLPDGMPANRYFGKQTEAAVREFQKRFGIAQVGFVGPLTRAMITKVCTGSSDAITVKRDTVPVVEQSIAHADAASNPDYKIISATLSRVPPVAGQAYEVKVTIANSGGAANNAPVAIFADGQNGAPDYRASSRTLQPGEVVTFTLANVEPSKLLAANATYSYSVTVDVLNAVSESNEMNNTSIIGPFIASATTGYPMPVEERNAAARALGFMGEFGNTSDDGSSPAWAAWRAAGNRGAVWSSIAQALVNNSGESVAEIYQLFPSLSPTFMTASGLTKERRDAIAHTLGFDGMFNVTEGSVTPGGEFGTWLAAVSGRQATFDAAVGAALGTAATAALGAPDYRIESATLTPYPPKDRQPFGMEVTVKNYGGTTGNNSVKILAQGGGNTPRYQGTASALAAGASASVTLTNLDPSTLLSANSSYAYTVTVDILNAVVETNESNNTFSVGPFTPSNVSASGLPIEERNTLARAIGYTGDFGIINGVGSWGQWLEAGSRTSVWETLTSRLLANAGDSTAEIYQLFPNLNPSYITGMGLSRERRDAIIHALGFDGMFNIQDAGGTAIYDTAEWSNWLDQNGKRAAFDLAVAAALGRTASGLTFDERNALARAMGYWGEFGEGGIAAWLASGSRQTVWNTVVARLLANPGDSTAEIYQLFPSLNPNYMTACNVTKTVRDQKARDMGFDGMFAVIDSSGVQLGGEVGAWAAADSSRNTAWNNFCSPAPVSASGDSYNNLASALAALESALAALMSGVGR